MAFIFGAVFNSFLCQRNFVHKQIINNIQKCTMVTASKRVSDKSIEIIDTLSHLLNTNDLSEDLCFRVRNEIINKNLVSEQAVDTRILDACTKERKFEFAKAYVKFLESNGYPVNIFALGAYLQIYSTEKPASDSEENEIINIYERIQEVCECIPDRMRKNCIVALCKTSKWEKALELIEDNISDEQNSDLISHIIAAAFRNGEPRMGLKLLHQLYDPHMNGHRFSEIYDEYLNYYMQKKPAEFKPAIEKIFVFWKKYDIIPTKDIIDKLVDTCITLRWEANYVAIKRKGYCPHCENHLSEKSVDEKAFKKLTKEIISKTLIDTDIFQNSTPEELQRFKSFIYKTKPYDIVIDGLNVSNGYRNQQWLKDIVKHFSDEHKKILVIARQHMYPHTKWILPMYNVYIYFFQNLTKDDPYLLYATLVSGNDAKLVTFDLLRQHIHKLENIETKSMFRRWQYTHQYTWSLHNRKFNLAEPWLFEPYIQYKNGYWHVPYRLNSEKNKLLARPVDTWVCLRTPKE